MLAAPSEPDSIVGTTASPAAACVGAPIDPNGNLTGDGLTSYTWNARNQLVGLSGGTSAGFQYDGVGRRRSKTVGGTTTQFLYDDLNLVQELAGGGTPTANLLTGLRVDETFTRTDSGGTSPLLTDALGSTLELADNSGTLQTHYAYEPFGATTTSGAASTNAVQFTGRENDGTGLYGYRARFYNPTFQRFVSEDPIGFCSGLNLYSYVGNRVTQLTDPTGMCPFCPAIPWVAPWIVDVIEGAALAILTSAAESAANRQMRDDACWRQYDLDIKECNKLSDPNERRECYAQAQRRRVACSKGQWVPPLIWPKD